MKKRFNLTALIFILVFLIITGIIFGSIFYASTDYVRITSLDYKAEVVDEENSSGKVIITERLTFDVHAASKDNLFWELWRELPEAYYDGVLVNYNVLSVKEILEDGTEVIYPESPKLYWDDYDFIDIESGLGPGKWYHSPGPYDDYYYYESLIFYVDGLYRETIVYEIQYEMFNASLRYQDASELYLAFYSGDTTKYLKNVTGEILIPLNKMPASNNYHAYTYGTNAHQFPFNESTTVNPGYHTFSFQLNEADLKFQAYNNYLEFALIAFGNDAHKFTEYASINNYYYSNKLEDIEKAQARYEILPEVYHQKKVTLFNNTIIASLLSLVVVYFISLYYKRKYSIFKAELEIDFFRDIPSDLDANFARKLVFSKHKEISDLGDGYAAAMLSLTQKGYLDIRMIDASKKMNAKNIILEVLPQTTTDLKEPLTTVERAYLDLIARHTSANTVVLNNFQSKVKQDFEYTNNFLTQVKNAMNSIGVDDGYFQKFDYKAPKQSLRGFGVLYIVLAFLVVLIGNLAIFETRLDLAFGAYFISGAILLVGAFILFKISKRYLLFTQFGENEYMKWRGLYNFLNDETLMVERGVLELAIWEKYLIYATAFGISDKVIKVLKVVIPEAVIASSPILYNRVFHSNHFYNTSSRAFSVATQGAVHTHRSGGHAGYGGGGRGGGGGGGGH